MLPDLCVFAAFAFQMPSCLWLCRAGASVVKVSLPLAVVTRSVGFAQINCVPVGIDPHVKWPGSRAAAVVSVRDGMGIPP